MLVVVLLLGTAPVSLSLDEMFLAPGGGGEALAVLTLVVLLPAVLAPVGLAGVVLVPVVLTPVVLTPGVAGVLGHRACARALSAAHLGHKGVQLPAGDILACMSGDAITEVLFITDDEERLSFSLTMLISWVLL